MEPLWTTTRPWKTSYPITSEFCLIVAHNVYYDIVVSSIVGLDAHKAGQFTLKEFGIDDVRFCNGYYGCDIELSFDTHENRIKFQLAYL